MTRLRVGSAAAVFALAAVLAVEGAGPAAAHERRTVGAFAFVVGWGDEPSYTGFKNRVQVTVTEATSTTPVTDLTDSLAVEVIKGADKTRVPLVANFGVGAFGTPGDHLGATGESDRARAPSGSLAR